MSRGLAIVLLVVYLGSRIFLYLPLRQNNTKIVAPNAQLEHKEAGHHPQTTKPVVDPQTTKPVVDPRTTGPDVDPWSCIVSLLIAVALMSATVDFVSELSEINCFMGLTAWSKKLVESIEDVQEAGHIQQE